MALSITQVENFAVEVLNASQPSSPYGTIVSRRFKDGEAKDSIILGDSSTVRSILNQRGHGRRKDFMTGSASGLAHGAQLATRCGPIEAVTFVVTGGKYAGTVLPIEWADTNEKRIELEQDIRNPLNNPFIFPTFILSGDTIFHNGAGLVRGGASSVSVAATWCNFVLTAACQAPDEFIRAVALAAIAIEMMKDGQRVSAGSQFENMFRAEMGERDVPGAEIPQQEAQAA
jgi:hypothetical protein